VVGGFDARYFMYGEDLDLGLRLRLAGWGSGVAPAAEVVHDYAFTKGDYKWFWLERNRAWTVLGAYPCVLLAALAPALLAFEVVLLALAWRGGWLRAKLRAQVAVVRELPVLWARRAEVQATRTVSAREFAQGLSDSLDSPNLAAAQAIPGAEALQAAYWRLVCLVVRG
jgi:N-acetylglucosaminyl-diphospho-decaprenol L-rhamnosyltransferase